MRHTNYYVLAAMMLFLLLIIQVSAAHATSKPKPPPPVQQDQQQEQGQGQNQNQVQDQYQEQTTGVTTTTTTGVTTTTTAGGGAGGEGGEGGSFQMHDSFNTDIPPNAYAASLVAMGRCWGSASGGFGNDSVALTFGKTYESDQCNTRQNSLLMASYGHAYQAVEILCGIDMVYEADRRLPKAKQQCSPRKDDEDQDERNLSHYLPVVNYGQGVTNEYSNR